MRGFVLLVLLLAGCAPQPPQVVARQQPPPSPLTTPDPRYIPPPPAGRPSPAVEGAEIWQMWLRSETEARAEVRRRAAQRAETVPPNQRARVRAEEERRILRSVLEAGERHNRDAEERERYARQDDYCQDYASDVWSASASSSEFLAVGITGVNSRQQRIYRDCMSSFRRVNRYMDR